MTTNATLHGTSWILGAPTDSAGAPRFRARAAADGRELLPEFFAAPERDVDRAAAAAKDAFPAFRATPPEARARLLERIAALLAERGGGLVERAMAETGLARPRLEGELARTTNQLRSFAALVREGSWVDAVIDHADPTRAPLPKPDVRTLSLPLGPVAVFGASNFPLAFSVAGGDTASALAAGCPVVVKGHPLHPGTGELAARAIVDALRECALPAGAFAFLQAGGARDVAVGLELVRHDALEAVGFTGSFAGGTALARAASMRARPIPVFAEMGSVNPVFLLPGAVREKRAAIVSAFASSIAGSAGQLCTRPGLLFAVEGADAEALVVELAKALDAAAPHAMLSRAHRAAWEERTEALARIAGVERVGASAVSGTHTPRAGSAASASSAGGSASSAFSGGASSSGATDAGARPKLLRADLASFEREPALLEECFGPSAIVVLCANERELQDAVQRVPGSLTATVWSAEADRALARELLPLLARVAGRVVHDGVPTGVEVCAAMVHSGPFPACTRPDSTSVGARAIRRWCRPVAFQNVPDELLPEELCEANPRGIARLVDGRWRAAPERSAS
ncbi:MAG: aldehyde dehydrogenase (NADP(+)) [Planctomycetes bacterium]|nr:aldehyde dehydrogenase (NADP(+)) [Planctomycetota bacterium]